MVIKGGEEIRRRCLWREKEERNKLSDSIPEGSTLGRKEGMWKEKRNEEREERRGATAVGTISLHGSGLPIIQSSTSWATQRGITAFIL